MSRFRLAYGSLLPFVVSVSVAIACGGASDSSLFGSKPGGATSGGAGGATSVSGAGGTSLATGGAGGSTDLGAGGESELGSGGTSERDSGVHEGGVGGLGGQGGQASGGAESTGGATGSGGEAGVAWARCNTDADCVGGRVCTKSAQAFLVSGRPGGCVHHCGINTAQCDPPPSVGTVSCTQLLVASFCTINCASGNLCPTGMDCISGVCYYSN